MMMRPAQRLAYKPMTDASGRYVCFLKKRSLDEAQRNQGLFFELNQLILPWFNYLKEHRSGQCLVDSLHDVLRSQLSENWVGSALKMTGGFCFRENRP